MLRQSFILLLALCLTVPLFAQDKNVKLTTAMVDYNGRNYAKAMKNFDFALDGGHSGLKEKNVPKAYFHRAKCRILLFTQRAKAQDTAFLRQNSNAVLLSYDDYKMARETDDGKWGKKISAEMAVIVNQALNGGLQGLNMSYKLDGEKRKEVVKGIIPYFDIACAEDNKNYMGFDLRGQAKLTIADTAGAYEDFNTSRGLFNSNPPKQADQLIAYVYYRAALIERYANNDLDKALASIQQGLQVAEKEHIRMMGTPNLSEEKKAQIKQQFEGVQKDLKAFELDIYLNSPDKLQEALAKFENGIKENPNDYTVHVAYASMLEKVDRDKAIEIYKKAIAIDAGREIAHFNLGALYNNIAKEWYDKAMAETDYEKADSLQKIGDQAFADGYPHFQNALKANPKSLSTVKALKQIALRLEKMDDFEEYKKIEKELTGG